METEQRNGMLFCCPPEMTIASVNTSSPSQIIITLQRKETPHATVSSSSPANVLPTRVATFAKPAPITVKQQSVPQGEVQDHEWD